MVDEERCIVVLSGGPDSSTVAYWTKKEGYDIYAMTFKYDQIATKEVESAERIAKELAAPIKVVDLPSLREIFTGVASLCDESIPMTSSFSEPIIAPFRNGILLSVAIAYAEALGVTRIFHGAQGSNEPFYPDCRKEFYESFETTARLGTGRDIIIEAPFSQISKSDLVKIGTDLGVPYDLTWSCYLNGGTHCGRCESCTNRRKAFEPAGIEDATKYDSELEVS